MQTDQGSSDSPTIPLETYKVVGIHFGGSINKNYGIFIKYIIDEFIIDNNLYKKEINIKYKREKKRKENIFGEKLDK